ncbi:hypothetical protein H2200_010513 [Cladophialophora chaetospira]|uniref:BRCT domain-containing protein n=1 Tax=Cladophialophora chaetospira TaxID=386627 RepID=A0AA39CEA7_9EURO|nr:hypothetical protein H2200_010513 [Cladophialophora chaetospira]
MAPRKPASPAKPRRITRARAGDADTTATATTQSSRRKATKDAAVPTTTLAKAIESKSRVTKKSAPATTKPVKGGRVTTRSTKVTPVLEPDEGSDNETEPAIEAAITKPVVKATRTTRKTEPPSGPTGLAAAPRRRIKVTPLVNNEPQPEPALATVVEEEPRKKSSGRTKKENAVPVVKPATTTRTKRNAGAAGLVAQTEPEPTEPETKKRGRTTRAAKSEEEVLAKTTTETTVAPTKSRGRPKKEKVAADQVEEPKIEATATRRTRARTASVNSSVLPDPVSVVVPKKKVTFEPLPGDDEDEKENKRPKTTAKGKATKASTTTKKTEPAATGMRAKPIRKAASARTTKATRATAAKAPAAPADEMEVDEPETRMPRALTPKKITQVAKAVSTHSEDEEDEDELSGAKTPVRNLSLSPRRGLTPSAVRPLSPVKTLDFATALRPFSPEKSDRGEAMSMLSPPRRMPTSPSKDLLKETPRRAPEGVSIFRAQIPASNGVSLSLSPSKNQSLLQQSAKRGLAEKIVFPPSAMKSLATPLKTPFLSSPARRLFSASKSRTPARASPSPKKLSEKENASPLAELDEANDAVHEVEVSSHFRSSVSPQRSARVYRLSEDELAQEMGLNFDESVLSVRSPLKVDKVKPVVADAPASTIKSPAQRDIEVSAGQAEDIVEMETPEDSVHEDTTADEDNDDTIMDPALEHEEASEDEEEAPTGVSLHEISIEEPMRDHSEPEQTETKPRISDILFNRLRQVNDDDSEDELAGDQTPDDRMLKPSFRPSLSAANIKSRLSTGIVPPSASQNLGFTPLAAQVQGWRAASPEKRTAAMVAARSQGLFSPVARMHVDGAVELSRPDTPGSKRKSLADRLSLAPSMAESPLKPDFFADGMAAQDFEDQAEAGEGDLGENEDLHDFVEQDVVEAGGPVDADDGEHLVEEDDDKPVIQASAELTTDLVNLTHASDTAMVDFNALAHEAEELAQEDAVERDIAEQDVPEVSDPLEPLETVDEEQEQSILSTSSAASDEDGEQGREAEREDEQAVEEEHSMLSTSSGSGSFADENEVPVDHPTELVEAASAVSETPNEADEEHDSSEESTILLHNHEPEIGTPAMYQDDISHITAASIEISPARTEMTPSRPNISISIDEMDFTVTPVRPDPSVPRQIHTVVSKVPLRPEGTIAAASVSPLKNPRKRTRSLSASTPQGSKRRSLGLEVQAQASAPVLGEDLLMTPRGNAVSVSPQRRVRSAAPSPAHSLASGLTTPGQISFAIDDFGNSTLDGIEMPEDEDEIMSDDVEHEQNESVVTIGSAMFKTPVAPAKRSRSSLASESARSNGTATPSYAMSTKSSKSRIEATPRVTPSKVSASASKTPATATKTKTPSTMLKSKLAAKTPQTSRTPLQAVGNGILHGAVVHTDIHTSEGMDASAFYIDTLTAMGARVVRDWRWNPRLSVAPSEQEHSTTQALSLNDTPGITHVVYKDGGKRTLEKVRAAKGQVLCVGVGWVLDCMREGKWLDEATYAVDQTIMPRGGSRRRKSMEPRMLVNENGSLSASKERRSRSFSVGVESSGMSKDLKLDLINTPVRGREILQSREDAYDATEISEETEISSTYQSPTAATVGGGGDTANVGLLMAQQDAMRTPGSFMSRRHINVDASTPESISLAVDYDPRTAATPLTPYLVAKGRGLIQMSAPPKQENKGIFDQDEEDSILAQKENQSGAGRKFQVKGGKKVFDGRRKTLGGPGLAFKPVVGSPLRKE